MCVEGADFSADAAAAGPNTGVDGGGKGIFLGTEGAGVAESGGDGGDGATGAVGGAGEEAGDVGDFSTGFFV